MWQITISPLPPWFQQLFVFKYVSIVSVKVESVTKFHTVQVASCLLIFGEV